MVSKRSNLRVLVATFIMAEIVDLSQDFSSPYHVSSQQPMICSLDTQQERQIFGSYVRRYISKVCNHCGKTRHVIDTCYRKHGFPPQFKFKNIKQTVIVTSRIMKVQGQRYTLSKLFLLLSNIKHC